VEVDPGGGSPDGERVARDEMTTASAGRARRREGKSSKRGRE
jgi:hypothetical protein